jgi:microcystin-dependent protein
MRRSGSVIAAMAGVSVLIATSLISVRDAHAQGSVPYVGEIRWVGFNFAPAGWVLCDGRLLSITNFPLLHAVLRTTYGGDGVTTFGVPDLPRSGRDWAGSGPGADAAEHGR